MSTFSQRLLEAIEARATNVADVARKSGVPYPTLKGIVDGYQQKSSKTTVLAKALGVRVEWLADGIGARDIIGHEDATEPTWADVLGYAQSVSLGDGEEGVEYAETHKLKFRAKSLARQGLNPSALAVVYGRGDSMLPRIHHGDAILFDRNDTTPRDEKLFVVHTAGAKGPEYSAKRCRVLDDLVLFDALNPEGDHHWRKPRRMDDPRRPIEIVGRIRWIGSWEA